jgi:hypothetical protein
MSRSLAARVAKIEAQCRPPEGLFYLTWIEHEDDHDQALASALAAVPPGTPILVARWRQPHEVPPPESGSPIRRDPGVRAPPPRWITKAVGELSHRESEGLGDSIMIDDEIERIERVLESRGESELAARANERSPDLSQMSDAELYALIMGSMRRFRRKAKQPALSCYCGRCQTSPARGRTTSCVAFRTFGVPQSLSTLDIDKS